MVLKLIFLLSLSGLAFAQLLPVSVGIKAGYVNNRQTATEIWPFKAGPYVELSLPFLPIFETGVLFERYRAGSQTLTVYQVPVLVKKRFNAVAIKPFLSGGATVRMIPSRDERSTGVTVAAGVTVGLLPIKIEPEIRFTRWIQSGFTPKSQQTEVLVGIRF